MSATSNRQPRTYRCLNHLHPTSERRHRDNRESIKPFLLRRLRCPNKILGKRSPSGIGSKVYVDASNTYLHEKNAPPPLYLVDQSPPVEIILGNDASTGFSVVYYQDWNPTLQFSITREGFVQNVDRPDVHRVLEDTECGEPAAQPARVVIRVRLEGGLEVPE